jgi:hypothetical protein
MKVFRAAPPLCAQHQSDVTTRHRKCVAEVATVLRWISKWLMRGRKFLLVKVSPRRRGACRHARSHALCLQPSTTLSTRIVDNGEILTLPATCAVLLRGRTTIARNSRARSGRMHT